MYIFPKSVPQSKIYSEKSSFHPCPILHSPINNIMVCLSSTVFILILENTHTYILVPPSFLKHKYAYYECGLHLTAHILITMTFNTLLYRITFYFF